MLRRLYIRLMWLHPAGFRQRFGDDMLQVFDDAGITRDRWLLLADEVRSLFRQWVFRPEFHAPLAPIGAAPGIAGIPRFVTMDEYKPRPAALVHGGLLSILLLCAMVSLIGRGGRLRAFVIGVHRSMPSLLHVDRSSMEGTDLNTTVTFPPEREDPWQPIAAGYFRNILVLKAIDADGDLVLTPWEIRNAPAVLGRLDKDGDGVLSAEECGFKYPEGTSPQEAERAWRTFLQENPAMSALNTDHDGVISGSEIARSAASLRTLDRNRDGNLTPDELIPKRETMFAAMLMLRLDKNGDGKISGEELVTNDAIDNRELVRSADRDHDGIVTREELELDLRFRVERAMELQRARRAAGYR